MYSVSNEYISALRRSVKYDRITGQIRLADGTRIEINNNVVVQGKLSITRSVCGGSFDIGAFNAARMSITIKDEAAYDHEFGNATISLYYGLLTDIENDVWEDVPLGVFYVDGHYTMRSGGTVSLQAFDGAGKFEIEPPKLDGITTLYGALQQACLKANVGLAISESEFNAFPNAAIVPDFSSKRIQSCRDIVIWVAQAVGTSAFIDRNNFLALKRYHYAGGNVYDRMFTANERSKIKFTDTRTYFAYLSNYCAGEPKMYSNILSFTGADAPHVKEGGLTLPENPLLLALTAEQQDAANMALMKNYSAPTRYIKASGIVDPAVDPLDVVAFKDGSIDIGQIISVCTKTQWKYRGSGYIECNNFDEYSPDDSVSAVALADTEAQTDTNYARTSPKSQTQKQIDELKTKGGGTIEQAVIIQQNDLTKFIDKYEVIRYFHGNRVVYTAGTGDIVCGGYLWHGTYTSGSTPPEYTKVYINGDAYEHRVRYVGYSTGTNYSTYVYQVERALNGEATSVGSSPSYGDFGMYLRWMQIHAPDDTYPYGYVSGMIIYIRTASPGAAQKYNSDGYPIECGFLNEAEYNAAVGLTYDYDVNEDNLVDAGDGS